VFHYPGLGRVLGEFRERHPEVGVSIVSAWAVAPRIARGDLHPLAVPSARLHRTWRGLYLKRSPVAPAALTLLTLLRRHGVPQRTP